MTWVPNLLRIIYPLWLRERIYYRGIRNRFSSDLTHATLVFAPNVKLKLLPSDRMHQCIAYTGLYELTITKHIYQLAKEGGLLVDVGANIGYYTCIWTATQKENTAIAFEAAPRNIDLLRQNVRKNSFDPQVTVSSKAVGRTEGEILFDPGPSELSGQGSFALGEKERHITVNQTPLDDYFATSDVFIDVLKIDIEGADTWALEGAEKLLKQRRIGHIFFEQYTPHMKSLGIREGQAHELLRSYGYEIEQLGSDEYHAFRV